MNNTTKLIAIAVVALAGAYYFLAPDQFRPLAMKSDFERYCLACEEVLSGRLKSPSSYTRTSCEGPYTEAATQQSYLLHDQSTDWAGVSSWTKDSISDGTLLIATAFLRYEAANSYGAQIAGLEACTTDLREGQQLTESARILGPNVGGFSKTGWIINQLTTLQ